MDGHNILSLLGLALRGGRLAVGEEPVEAVARAKDARLLLLAADAAAGTRRRVEHFSQVGQCLWLTLPCSKAELGQALGRSSAAVAAVTDVGLAHAVARRLAELDPAQYGEAAERLALKAQRAAERQAERKAHQRNVRQGVHRARPPEKPGGAGRAAPPEKPSGARRGPGRQGPAPGKPPAAGKKPAPWKQPEGGPRPGGDRKAASGRRAGPGKSSSRPNPYAHSRPVKKGKGSFRKRES